MTEFIKRLDKAAASQRGLTYGPIDKPLRRTWQQIRDDARTLSGFFAAKGIGPGDTVAVIAGESAGVATVAQALWQRRAALTMLQQPTTAAQPDMWAECATDSCTLVGARHCIYAPPFERLVRETEAQFRRHGISLIHLDEARSSALVAEVGGADDADIAMRQLTSGSTGAPKAVSITFANLIANTDALYQATGGDRGSDVSVSWLPLSHDMGMVAFLIGPMLVGGEAIVVSPEVFLRHPANWAKLIDRHQATITCGPNFSYKLLARTLDNLPDGAVDLRSLRVAINGSEPINRADVEHFMTAGSRFGLPTSAMTPAYGLAEATLAVTFSSCQEVPRFDIVSRRALTDLNRAVLVDDGPDKNPDVVAFTSVGRPVTAMQLRISDDHGGVDELRTVGRIEIRGPSIAANYTTLNGPERVSDDEGWFDTGDLGYLDERGDVYICGRRKDLIIVNGKNLYPTEIECAAAEVADVRSGCVAAVRLDGPGQREGFAVLAETDYHPSRLDQPQVTDAIKRQIFLRIGYWPRHIQLLPAGALPKTPSGKLRRNEARALLDVANGTGEAGGRCRPAENRRSEPTLRQQLTTSRDQLVACRPQDEIT